MLQLPAPAIMDPAVICVASGVAFLKCTGLGSLAANTARLEIWIGIHHQPKGQARYGNDSEACKGFPHLGGFCNSQTHPDSVTRQLTLMAACRPSKPRGAVRGI